MYLQENTHIQTRDALSPLEASIIEGYAHSLRPAMTYLMIVTVFSSMLISLMIALFYFSDAQVRRRPGFILNVCCLMIGITLGMLIAFQEIRITLSPLQAMDRTLLFFSAVFNLWTPWMSESILILRLIAVFQPCSKLKMVALLAFPIAIKSLRAAMYILYLRRWYLLTRHPITPNALLNLSTSWVAIVAWSGELVDNLYMSGMFLTQLWLRGHPFGAAVFSGSSTGTPFSFRQRLRTLFLIAATTFVIPVVFDIVQITTLSVSSTFIFSSYVADVNLYMVIICTVLATVWSQSLPYQTDKQARPAPISVVRFAEPVTSTEAEDVADRALPLPDVIRLEKIEFPSSDD